MLAVAHDQPLIAEEAIAILDKNNDCRLSHDELISFMEKWAKKKHQKLSLKSKKFVDIAFKYIDDNHDGVVDPCEMHYAMHDLVDQFGTIADKAEDIYAFV